VRGFAKQFRWSRNKTIMSATFDLKSAAGAQIVAPVVNYAPPMPKHYRPKIGLIGCGGITEHHLRAYRAAGWEVAALFNRHREKAEQRRAEFCPEAKVYSNVAELLALREIDVVDIATHPDVRGPLIEAALRAGKHVLSQKPFVLDLNEGTRLTELAQSCGVKLAINQNGRWAPYFYYLRQLVRSGLIGEVSSVNISINWDHTWTVGTAFAQVHHLVLYDFGIHWFDAVFSFFGGAKARSVYASVNAAPGQPMQPPLVATSIVTFPTGIASLDFNGFSRFGQQESCTIVGTQGTLRGVGGVCSIATVEVSTAAGTATTNLEGSWFPDGFRGAMGELLCAIEENREPENSAAANLKSLALCLGAMKSADEGRVIKL
jgi:predicted dehydrogenase